jgi:hypothetical protein
MRIKLYEAAVKPCFDISVAIRKKNNYRAIKINKVIPGIVTLCLKSMAKIPQFLWRMISPATENLKMDI